MSSKQDYYFSPERVGPVAWKPYFPPGEYVERMTRVRDAMRNRSLDALLVSSPENIYYLTGLDHYGYFAVTVLVLPIEGNPTVVVRAIEEATIANQCTDVLVAGFADTDDPAEAVVLTLERLGLATSRLGLEKDHMFLPIHVGETLHARLSHAQWADGSRIVEELRLTKAPAEIAYTRQAATVTDRLARTCVETAGVGVNEREIVAEVYRAMILSGADPSGFPPILRSTGMLNWPHFSWHDRVLNAGDAVFFEVAGCMHRYHAPLGRFFFIGRAPRSMAAAEAALDGMTVIEGALRPGAISGDIYAAWQDVIDRAAGTKLPPRNLIAYSTGLGFPPSWMTDSAFPAIRPNGKMVVREGMVFHVASSTIGSVLGDYFVSDTALVTATGAEILTSFARG